MVKDLELTMAMEVQFGALTLIVSLEITVHYHSVILILMSHVGSFKIEVNMLYHQTCIKPALIKQTPSFKQPVVRVLEMLSVRYQKKPFKSNGHLH